MDDVPKDVHEIQQLLFCYVQAIDAREHALFDKCFAPDAEIELGGVGILTVESLKQTLATVQMDAMQHHLSMPYIKVSGDQAHSRCYFMAQHVRNDLAPRPCLMIGGWYTDDLERRPEGWRIVCGGSGPLWYDGNPKVLNYDFAPGAVARGPGHAAPAWLVE